MDLTLTPSGGSATVLCSDASRLSDGSPMGPGNLSVVEAPGIEMREYVGADRVRPENVRVNHGTVSFRATRVYPNASSAAAYALVGHLSEPVAGALKFGSTTIFEHCCVTSRKIGQSGCTVVVNYTIEG